MNPTEELKVGLGFRSMNRPAITALLDAGADIDVRDEGGWTVLIRALNDRSLEWCTELLERGANLQVRNSNDDTVWDYLEPSNGIPLYSLFLQYGADVNQYDANGWTALHRACPRNGHPLIRLLLAQGVDPRLPILDGSHKGQTAYDLGAFWWSREGRRARLQWDTVSIQEVFIVASEWGIVPIPSYLW